MYNREFTSDKDGITHINVYSKGKTEIGRLLSNFADTPFVFEPYGKFRTVEGFWYYYLTGCNHNQLKELNGINAKKVGRQLMDCHIDISEADIEIIKKAIELKIYQNKFILDELIKNDLPLAHYYVCCDGERESHIYKDEYKWVTDFIEDIRYNEIVKLIKLKLKNKKNGN